MIQVSIKQLLEMTEGELLAGDPSTEIYGVVTDSRAKQSGCLFVPLIGERFDAHEFVPQAMEQGAVATFWQKNHLLPQNLDSGFAVIGVEDTLTALQKLAKSYRRMIPAKVIGVTGSNGKTSTKDILSSVLSERFKVQKTKGNLNNHIGLPLMILSLDTDTEVAVLEMGMSALGEIAFLADIAEPSFGVITNIGEAHIEFLGSREKIADAKFELIESLEKNGLAVLFGDEPLLRSLSDKIPCPVQWFGLHPNNDIRAMNIKLLGMEGTTFSLEGDSFVYKLPIPGVHQVGNSLAAISIAKWFGMTNEEIAAGLAKARLSAMRMEVTPFANGGFVVNDAYNASPTSMKAALTMLFETPDSDYKVAVVGDMLELGNSSRQHHFELGKFAAEQQIDLLVAIGEYAPIVVEGAYSKGMTQEQAFVASTKQQAVDTVRKMLSRKRQPVVLVKASRGMRMEEVVTGLLM